jgi:uncharacterized membrane protein
MTTVYSSITIEAPISQVFAFFTDFERLPYVLHEAQSVTFLTPQHTGVGVEWVQLTEEDGPDNPDHRRVTEIVEPTKLVMKSDDKNALETIEFRFTAREETTMVNFQLDVQPKGLFARFMVRLLPQTIRAYMEADLQRVKEVLLSGQH